MKLTDEHIASTPVVGFEQHAFQAALGRQFDQTLGSEASIVEAGVLDSSYNTLYALYVEFDSLLTPIAVRFNFVSRIDVPW